MASEDWPEGLDIVLGFLPRTKNTSVDTNRKLESDHKDIFQGVPQKIAESCGLWNL